MQTISSEYLEMQKYLHKNKNYGTASLTFAPLVANLIRQTNIKSLCDYGAGKKRLLHGIQSLGVNLETYYPYDPVYPEYGPPRCAELVCCIDVLEHIEPDKLEAVLSDLWSITTHIGFFSIHTSAAAKFLPDGRNAHLIQESTSWWLPKICNYFEVLQLSHANTNGNGFWLVVSRK